METKKDDEGGRGKNGIRHWYLSLWLGASTQPQAQKMWPFIGGWKRGRFVESAGFFLKFYLRGERMLLIAFVGGSSHSGGIERRERIIE